MNESLTRSLSGIVYIVLLIGATSYSTNSFYILFGAFMLIAVYEFCGLVNLNKFVFPAIALVLFGASIYFKYDKNIDILLLIISVLTCLKAVAFLFNSEEKTITTSKYFYFLGYIVIPFILITKIPFGIKGYNPKIIISIFILIWTNDTFAYIVGKSIGKHKLLEKISPKKTIEGFFGGMMFSVIAGFLISKYYFNPSSHYSEKSIMIWTISGVIISVFSTLGDLIESKFKRVAGVKDSGKIMPGHGGILDRLDSVIFVAPFVFLFYQILSYVS